MPRGPTKTATVEATTGLEPRPSSAFACLWIADVPTWILERLDVSLEGRAVIAANVGRVIGANALARRSGVRVGDPVERARGLCPDGVFRGLEVSIMKGTLEDALEGLNAFTPWLEAGRSGAIYTAGLTPEDAVGVARAFKLRVGLSGSRDAALLAALCARADHARLEPHQERFLELVPLHVLRGAGIGTETLERLALFGLRTLGALRERVSKDQLERQFPADAARLSSLMHGSDARPVALYEAPPSFTARLELEEGCLEPMELYPVLERLVSEAGAQLTRHLAGALVLTLHTSQGPRSSRIHLKDFTRDPKTLLRAARKALLEAQGGLEVGALSLRLTDLSKPRPRAGQSVCDHRAPRRARGGARRAPEISGSSWQAAHHQRSSVPPGAALSVRSAHRGRARQAG